MAGSYGVVILNETVVNIMGTRNSQELSGRELKILRLFIAVVLLFSLLFLFFAPGRGLWTQHSLKQEIKELVRKNKELQEQNVRYAGEIERLKHDEAYIEDLARHKYGMLKKNEEVYNYKDPAGKKKE